MHGQPTTIAPESRVTGHLQVRERGGVRQWQARVTDRDLEQRPDDLVHARAWDTAAQALVVYRHHTSDSGEQHDLQRVERVGPPCPPAPNSRGGPGRAPETGP